MSGPFDANFEQRAQEITARALALPAEHRSAFVGEQCTGDPTLRARVEELLADEERRQSYAAAPTLDPSTGGSPPQPGSGGGSHPSDHPTIPAPESRPAPQQIGPYKLLEQIGEGGFGTVYIADQQSPVRRRVALKIIKPGMDSRAVIARFEQERQALAIMDHPNIARVLDAGTAPDGRPYFVMEYVAGEAITAYCDRNRLNLRQRLELFISVCDAVQHAHHKGIIHRDIKPSNILVTVSSGNPVVKVIDFGVAKALSHVLTDKTIFTEHGQILGTPEYMSPEQAEMGALDIDTRTDVYSLGVVLYELLTGALPFEPRDLRSKGYNEIQRIIREVDPPKPSTRLRSLGVASADVAQRRQSKLEELEGQLRRELEWIPLKAMRKDRAERYATPLALADDIRNHLAGRPLTAGPESAMYRARKFVTRNKVPVAAAAAIVIALMLGAIVSTIGFMRASRNERMYREQYVRADAENARQRQINLFIRSLLASANPTAGERRDVTVRELLDGAVAQLDGGALLGEPRIEAAVRSTLGNTYRSLSLWPAAEAQWRKAFDLESTAAGLQSAEAALALAGLGQVQLDTGRLDEAEKSLQQALTIQRASLAPDDMRIGDTINNLGLLADARGDHSSAKARYAEALAIYQKNPREGARAADAMTNLATIHHKLGERRQAIDLAQQALGLRRKLSGNRSVDVWNSLMNLASLQEAADELVTAERTRREALELARELVDEKHRMTVTSMGWLARTLWLRGTAAALDEADQLQTRALELARGIDGEQSLSVARGLDQLACIARDRGNHARAVELFQNALAMRRVLQPGDHPDVAAAMSQLADALVRAGQPDEAIPLAQGALDIRKKVFPAGHWAIWNTTSVLGGALAESGEFEQAEPMLLESYKGLEAGSVLGKRPRIDASERLIRLYEKWGKPDQAEQWRQTRAALLAPSTSPGTAPVTQP